MEQLFAPWRIEWVEREEPASTDPNDDGCVFCRLSSERTDRTNRIVARADGGFVLLNNYPYNPGHVMVIPDQHTGSVPDLGPETIQLLGVLTQHTLEALEMALQPDGYNVGMNLGAHAGGSITDHLHTHVVPRWGGDTNFMPVVADTKVIVEAVDDTYDRLHTAFAGLDAGTYLDDDRAIELAV